MSLKYAGGIKRKRDKFGKVDRKVQIKFDKLMLEMFVGYVASDSPSINRTNYINLQKLMEIIDITMYESDVRLYDLICFIRLMLEARLQRGMTNINVIASYCLHVKNTEGFRKIVDGLDLYAKLQEKEIQWINKAVTDRLKYAYIIFYRDLLMQDFEKIDATRVDSYEDAVNTIREDVTHLLAEMRSSQDSVDSNSFTLEDGLFESSVTDIVNKLKDKSRRFTTGLRALNGILSPGFMSGKLYMFLARTGNFKSGLLLSIAKWFKTLNYNVQPRRNPDAIPTVLLLTTENSIAETVERLFAMVVPGEDMEQMSPIQVINELKTTGGMTISMENRVNIRIEYRNDREIDTNDIYGLIEDIEMGGAEVIALIVDYIKRVRAAESGHGDERIELKNCSSELKNLAENLDIPVITAMQINRAGNQVVEQAMTQSKEDLAKFMGATNVANCWDLIENSDWVCIINIERHKESGQYYLTFKLVKIRYADKSEGRTYFNQPFADNDKIRLIEDVMLPQSVAINSMSIGLKKDAKEESARKGKTTTRKRIDVMSAVPDDELSKFCAGVDNYATKK